MIFCSSLWRLTIKPYRFLYIAPLLALLSCQSSDGTPPAAAITSPAIGSTVAGTTAVQITAQDSAGIATVEVYARGKGSQERGVRVGSAVGQGPYVVTWNTTTQPNVAELELIAVATDTTGNKGESTPVLVKTQNSGVPNLKLLAAYTVPPKPAAAALESSALPEHLLTQDVLPPITIPPTQPFLETQADEARSYILEWQWDTFNGAEGYGVYRSGADLAGPYDLMIRQSGTAGSGTQKFSREVTDAKPGTDYFGTITSISNNATSETGFSNGDKAIFLPPQVSVSPPEGTVVSGGRPAFTWSKTNGAVGYLVYIYNKNPWDKDATLIWSNFPQSTASQSVSYPADRAELGTGTYWWWVAGISFDNNGKADGFTFSDPLTFKVP
jgi:Bacterial Ig domain